MRNRIIAMFTTRHLAEVPENPGRGIEGAQASTELQPIVRQLELARSFVMILHITMPVQ